MVETETIKTKPAHPKKRFTFEIVEKVVHSYIVDANTKKEALALLYNKTEEDPEGDSYANTDYKEDGYSWWMNETKAKLESVETLHQCRFHGLKMWKSDGVFTNRHVCRTIVDSSILRNMNEGDGFVCYDCRSALNDGFTFKFPSEGEE